MGESPAKPHWFVMLQGAVGIVAAIVGIVFLFLNYTHNDQKETLKPTPPGQVSTGSPAVGQPASHPSTPPNGRSASGDGPRREALALTPHLTRFLHKDRPDRAAWTVDGIQASPSENSTSRETILKLADGGHTIRAVWSTLDCTVHVDVPARVEPVLLACQPR
jgi:hypothetical protein